MGEPTDAKADYCLSAYYYGFDHTGSPCVDRVLACVAAAGKAFHHTEEWNTECEPWRQGSVGKTPVEWIENAAKHCAEYVARLESRLSLAEKVVEAAAWLSENASFLYHEADELDAAIAAYRSAK